MNWWFQFHTTYPVADAVGVRALLCLAGMALGGVRLRGVGLGTAGVLFAGVISGHFGKPAASGTLDFVKEFGVVLFVFTVCPLTMLLRVLCAQVPAVTLVR